MTHDLLRPRALYEGVAASLRERLFAHEFAPGAMLDEAELARGYGVSRTPVREALKVLTREGLLTMEPRRGCCVAELDSDDLSALLEVLELLELHTLRETARQGRSAPQATDHARLFTHTDNRYAAEAIRRLHEKLLLAFGPEYDQDSSAALAHCLGALNAALTTRQVDQVEAVWRNYMHTRRQLTRDELPPPRPAMAI